MATPTHERREDLERRLIALAIEERRAELDEGKTLLHLLVAVTIGALIVALVGAVIGTPIAGLAASGVLSTTALVYINRRRKLPRK